MGEVIDTEPHRVARRVDPIRVLFCVDNMGIGGTELNAVRSAERLDRARFDVSILCLQNEGPLLDRYVSGGIPVFCLPVGHLYGLTALRQGRRLARLLSDRRIDVVHSHDVYNNIFATLVARAARSPAVIASRRWWDEVPRPALRAVNRQSYRLADCVIANSATIARLLVEHEGVSSDRVVVIPNFVDDDAFVPLTDSERADVLAGLGVPAGATVIGCVASLRPVKDQESLLLAIASLRPRWPSLHLVLVGGGPCRGELEDLARRLEIEDSVHFAGVRPNEPNLHHLFDISVLCSLSEAFPNSILEAMAAGRPVVATGVGGVADAVVDGETGRLVARRSPEGLAAALEVLLHDPEGSRRMGRAGQRRAHTLFHARNVIPKLESLYTQLVATRAR